MIFIENKLLYPLPLLLGDGEALNPSRQTIDAFGYPVVYLANYADGQEARRDCDRLWRHEPAAARRTRAMAAEEVHLQAILPACISPLDGGIPAAAAASSGRLLIVEESQAAFGWGAEVAAQVVAAAPHVHMVRLGRAANGDPCCQGA